SKAPRSLGDHADADAVGFRFGERADLAVFCGKIAEANVHDARIGVSCAAHLCGFKRPVGEVPHHGFKRGKSKTFNTENTEKNRENLTCLRTPTRDTAPARA